MTQQIRDRVVPRVQREEDQVQPYCSFAPTQLALATLDDSQTPTPVLHNTSVKVGPPVHNYEHEAGSYGDGFT